MKKETRNTKGARRFLCLLCFLWFVPRLFAQTDSLTLNGTVFDTNAKPVAAAHIKLEEPTAQKTWTAETKPDGTFHFDRLTFGTYRITVQQTGYFPTGTEVRLQSSQTVEFTLAAAETVNQEIDVVARPEPINVDSVAPQNVVNNEVIQNIPFTGRQNFLNAVALTPAVVRDNMNQIHIYGSRSDQVRYQMDGLYLTDASAGGLGTNIPIDAIESVDMDLANYAAEFGKSSGGVVQVHSQFIGDKYRFNVTDFLPGWDFRQKSIADFSPRLLFSGPLVQRKLWFMYSGSLRYIHSFLQDIPSPEKSRTETDTDQLLKLQWNLKESHVLTMEVLHNGEYLGNAGLSVVRPQAATTNFLRRGWTVGVSDRRAARGKLFETTLQWSRRRESDLAKGTQPLEARPDFWSGNYFSDRRSHLQRARAAQTVAWDIETEHITHRLKAGAEFDWVRSSMQLDRRAFTILDTDGTIQQYIAFTGPDFADVDNQEYGAFIQDRMSLTKKLQVELGLRYDRERVAGRNNLGPRAAFSFLPFGSPRSKISGGVGLFYDNIALQNLQLPFLQRRLTTTYTAGIPQAAPAATDVLVNPFLRNPQTLEWNIGWEHEWAPRWVSRVEYVQKAGRNQIRVAAQPNAGGFNMLFNNSGTSDYHAVEFTVDRPIRTNLHLLGSYTYSNAKARPSLSLDFPDPAVEGIGRVPVDWDTPHRLVGWGYFPVPSHMTVSFSVEARSGFPYTKVDDLNHVVGAYNGQTLPAFFVTNAAIEKEIPIPFGNGKRMAFRIGATNLFNRFNPRFVDTNVNSPSYMSYSDSSSRHFTARVRILKK
jgi:outer membrane receptor for ferrienterochelin and colicin